MTAPLAPVSSTFTARRMESEAHACACQKNINIFILYKTYEIYIDNPIDVMKLPLTERKALACP